MAKADLLSTLEARFETNPERHQGVSWRDVLRRIERPGKLKTLDKMENSGGEPDVVAWGPSGDLWFVDCSKESPPGRRSLCYDHAARMARKSARPESSAEEMAAEMGLVLLDEAQYRALQTVGEFDLKTSSWVRTPRDVREAGGALFCDRRFGRVFVCHNGAEAYFMARGFRGGMKL
jgi:hypothetical protein